MAWLASPCIQLHEVELFKLASCVMLCLLETNQEVWCKSTCTLSQPCWMGTLTELMCVCTEVVNGMPAHGVPPGNLQLKVNSALSVGRCVTYQYVKPVRYYTMVLSALWQDSSPWYLDCLDKPIIAKHMCCIAGDKKFSYYNIIGYTRHVNIHGQLVATNAVYI